MKILLTLLAIAAAQDDIEFGDVFNHICETTTMEATIRATDLSKLGSWENDFSLITLNEGCTGEPDEFGNIIFSAGSLKNLPLECGTQYYDDGAGKVTFWNVVQYTPPNDSPITRDASGLYNFSCTYDMAVDGQQFELSLGHKVSSSPVDTIWFQGRTAEGKFRATMELFRDNNFEKSYKGYSVTLSLEQRLYIDVTLEASDPEVQLKVVKCWATPTINADDNVRHTLINQGCPTDSTVAYHDTAEDKNSARWETQMFQFVEESEVWLHCDIQACDSRKYHCDQTCDSGDSNEIRRRRHVMETLLTRERREVSKAAQSKAGTYSANILTVGPLRSKERYSDTQTVVEKDAVIGITVLGCLLIVALIVGLWYYCRVSKRELASNKLTSKPNNINNDFQLYGAPAGTEKKNPLQQW